MIPKFYLRKNKITTPYSITKGFFFEQMLYKNDLLNPLWKRVTSSMRVILSPLFIWSNSMKKLKLSLVIVGSLILTGCGSKIDCSDKAVSQDIKTLMEQLILEHDTFNLYYQKIVSPNVNVNVAAVREISESSNKKSKSCSATVTITAPTPERTTPMTNTMLMVSKLKLNKSAESQQKVLLDSLGPEAEKQDKPSEFTFQVTYTMSKLEKADTDGRKTQGEYQNLQEGYVWLSIRNLELVGSSLARPLVESGKFPMPKDISKEFIDEIEKSTDIQQEEKKIRLCALQQMSKEIPFDTYMAYINTVIAGQKNVMLGSAISEYAKKAPLADLDRITYKTRGACGDKGASKVLSDLENNITPTNENNEERPKLEAPSAEAPSAEAPTSTPQTGYYLDKLKNCKIYTPSIENKSGEWSGECKGGYGHGKGVLKIFLKNEHIATYEGSLLEGKIHGYGKYDGPDGVYVGEWSENYRSGAGKFVKKNGVTFEGNFKKGFPDGEVKVSGLSSGKSEVQTWADGKRLK